MVGSLWIRPLSDARTQLFCFSSSGRCDVFDLDNEHRASLSVSKTMRVVPRVRGVLLQGVGDGKRLVYEESRYRSELSTSCRAVPSSSRSLNIASTDIRRGQVVDTVGRGWA